VRRGAGGQSRHWIDAPLQIALPVFEDTDLNEDDIAHAQTYDALITASAWNQSVLKGYGLDSVLIHQGIDADLFQPTPKQRVFGDRLTVFSGGKLEYRKGQDQVVAAFRELLRTEPDALLVTAWANHWPIVPFKPGQCVDWTPGRTDRELLVNWLVDHGIPEKNQAHFGPVLNERLPNILHSCDVAVFPSRAEGGTNLCAMECMAAGIPTVISGSTGHCDLPMESCVRLYAKDTEALSPDAWCETNVEDLAALMQAKIPRTPLTGWTQQAYASNLLDCITRITGGQIQ
jgi:glycosyltransferase involved in cell wall biosynthesis